MEQLCSPLKPTAHEPGQTSTATASDMILGVCPLRVGMSTQTFSASGWSTRESTKLRAQQRYKGQPNWHQKSDTKPTVHIDSNQDCILSQTRLVCSSARVNERGVTRRSKYTEVLLFPDVKSKGQTVDSSCVRSFNKLQRDSSNQFNLLTEKLCTKLCVNWKIALNYA